MKNTIGKKILVITLALSLFVLSLLAIFITFTSSRVVTASAQLKLKGISEVGAANLQGSVNSVKISVLSVASFLNTLDSLDGHGRMHAEDIIKSMLENPHVSNAWLAYEPEAFDGRDSEYTNDYPGAPSGRFIRSYIMRDGQVVTAENINEETLDNLNESPWYVNPRDTGKFYTEAVSSTSNLYNYGEWDGSICAMTFAAPVFRGEKVIGCIGANMSFDIGGIDTNNVNQAAVAVFYPDGRVFSSQNPGFADDSLDVLGFTEAHEILASFSEGRSLFLPNQYSIFLNAKAFTYFQPVSVSDGDNLYLYTAIPRSVLLDRLKPIFILIAGIFVSAFIFTLFAIMYIKRKISNPLMSLMLAADAISMGDLETEIPSFPDSKDEIGVLSRSLHRMTEQFRIYIMRIEQKQEEMTIYSKIEELIANGNTPGTVDGILALVCGHLRVDKAMAVWLPDGSTHIFPRNEYETEDTVAGPPRDLPHNPQIMPMLAGKKLLLLNPYIISEHKADFLDKETRFACILSLRDGSHVLGYVILESKNKKNPFGSKTESVLCDIAGIIYDVMKSDEKRAEVPEPFPAKAPKPVPETPPQKKNETSSLEALHYVEGLDSDSAIKMMCGMADLYEQALKLLASMLPEIIEKLDNCLDSDIGAFAIEIHGLKGSLNNVGAYALGTEALNVEKAAKPGNDSVCRELYGNFKDALTDFHQNLVGAFEMESGKLPGNVITLSGLLPQAEEAVARDCAEAIDLLRPMCKFTFDLESDALLEKILSALENSDCQKASEGIQNLRERLSNWEGI